MFCVNCHPEINKCPKCLIEGIQSGVLHLFKNGWCLFKFRLDKVFIFTAVFYLFREEKLLQRLLDILNHPAKKQQVVNMAANFNLWIFYETKEYI